MCRSAGFGSPSELMSALQKRSGTSTISLCVMLPTPTVSVMLLISGISVNSAALEHVVESTGTTQSMGAPHRQGVS